MHSSGLKVSVVGSGIAGMATAIRLTMEGFKVEVFESNDYPGGKIFEWRHQGFRFDMGPTVFTMPDFLEELFVIAGKDMKDYLQIVQPEIPFHYFFNDGLELHFYADTDKLITEIAAKTMDDESTVRQYLKTIRTKFELTNNVFLHNSLHVLSNYLTKDALRGLFNFGKVEIFKTMDESNKNKLKDQHTVKLFNSFASYLGSNPYKAPGILNVISHFQINGGVFLPGGGMQSIVGAVYKLARELGIEFHFNQPVERIIIEDNKAKALLVEGRRIDSDLIVSNMDVYFAYKKLMPDQSGPKRILEHPKSHSVIVFHWGMDKTYPQLTLHNMFLAENMMDEYNTIHLNANIGEDFTFYIYISNKVNASDAPEGCENWYVLINAPHLQGQDWDTIRNAVRTRLLERLAKRLGEDIASHILFERIQDPRDFAKQTNVAFGAIYGNSFDNKFSVFLRHPNFSSKIKDLYFCGGSVHPGSGVPLSLLSGKIVTDLVITKSRKKKKKDVA